MKKKYLTVFLLLFLILFTFYFIKIQDKTNSPEITLQRAFNHSEAGIVSANVYMWGKIDSSKYKTIADFKNLANEFSEQLNMESGTELSTSLVENDFIKEITLNGVTEENDIVELIIHIEKSNKSDEYEESYITVNAAPDLSNMELEKTKERIFTIFKKYAVKPRVNSCITGAYDGKLEYTELNNICKQMFKEVEAKKVEGIREGNLISVSAYSPAIENYIKVKESKVNLNLAIRYNSLEDRTYIWIATPLILTEY